MTAVETPTPTTMSAKELGLIFQYTIEAYKTFEKLAEKLPNPMTAGIFAQFAADERGNRDLLEIKNAATGGGPARITLGADLRFSAILEGELSYRESAELLIARERTMQKRLRASLDSASASDRNLLIYLETVKRAHIVELERELQLISGPNGDTEWWKREDAEWRIVHGPPPA
jgi:rubrerythrin